MLSSEMLMIVPTRGRPEAVQPILDAWVETEASCHLRFCVDYDDPKLARYVEVLQQTLVLEKVYYVIAPRKRLAGTLNASVGHTAPSYSAVGFMGDDHRPRTKGWDRRFAECLSGGTGVVYGNDLLVGRKFPTAVMMTTDIPLALGYFCPPGLVHLCLDLVWKDWGEGISRITYLDDVVIEHLHPAAGKATLDAGYTECNSTEQVSADSSVYLAYRDNGGLAADLEKLRTVMR